MHYLADICLAQKLGSFACNTADKVGSQPPSPCDCCAPPAPT